jgi:magnesium transporter
MIVEDSGIANEQPPDHPAALNRARYSLIAYNQPEMIDVSCTDIDDLLTRIQPGYFHWITVRDVHDEAELWRLLDHYQLDPFILNEILDEAAMQFETEYENCLYLEYMVPFFNPDANYIVESKGSFILGRDYLILYEQHIHGLFARTRRRILSHQTKAQRYGPDYLLYLLLRAAIVEHFQMSFKRLTMLLETLEDRVLESHGEDQVYREILDSRGEVKPWNEPLLEIEDFLEFVKDAESKFISDEVGRLFSKSLYREVEDLLDYHERMRGWLKEIMDLHENNVVKNSNRIVQTLTVVSTIFLPLTFIAGVYGMNFRYMPELEQPWAYPATLLLMLVVALIGLVYMRRRRWF